MSDNFEAKLDSLETRVAQLELGNAVGQERHQSIVRRLDKIDSHVSRLVWLIIALLVGALLNFVIDGGLANVPI